TRDRSRLRRSGLFRRTPSCVVTRKPRLALGALLPGRRGRIQRMEAAMEFGEILIPYLAVPDGLGMGGEAATQTGARLWRSQRLGIQFMSPQPVDERFRVCEQRLERGPSATADHVVGILSRRQ